MAGLRDDYRQMQQSLAKMLRHIGRFEPRFESRISELRDDMENMLKLEIGGALANFETRLDDKLGVMDQKLDQLLATPRT